MTYFPLLIEYQDTKEKVLVQSPKEIKRGRSFKVIKTRKKKETFWEKAIRLSEKSKFPIGPEAYASNVKK